MKIELTDEDVTVIVQALGVAEALLRMTDADRPELAEGAGALADNLQRQVRDSFRYHPRGTGKSHP